MNTSMMSIGASFMIIFGLMQINHEVSWTYPMLTGFGAFLFLTGCIGLYLQKRKKKSRS